MNIETTFLCVVRAARRFLFAATLALSLAPVARAEVIYQQVFGNSTGSWKSTMQLATDWNEWLTYEGYAPGGYYGVGVTSAAGLSSTDTNIGAALTGTASSTTNGMLVASNTGGATCTMMAYTTALTLDPTAYSQLQFSWLQRSANFAADYTRVVVCVGSKWYMSSTNLMTSSASAETLSYTFDATASSWYQLTSGSTINTSTIPYHTNIESLVTSPATDLSGNITGFGVLLACKSTSFLGVDSFAVNAVPEPASACLLVLGSLALLGGQRRRARQTF